jgi:radical SAM-linked protein
MSALDLVRIFSHMMLACGVKLKYTEGFNPQPRMVLLAPLPVGVGGTQEVLLFEAYGLDDDIIARLNARSVDGLSVKAITKAAWAKNLADFTMTFKFDEQSFAKLLHAHKAGQASYDKLDKKGRPKTIKLEDYLAAIDSENHSLTVSVSSAGGFHFPEFFRKSGYEDSPSITRTELRYA